MFLSSLHGVEGLYGAGQEVRRLDKWEKKGTIAIQIFFNIQVLFPDILEQPCNAADILDAILRKIGIVSDVKRIKSEISDFLPLSLRLCGNSGNIQGIFLVYYGERVDILIKICFLTYNGTYFLYTH